MASRSKLHTTALSTPTSYQKTILSNGIRVVSEEISSVKSVSIGIWIDTGSRHESAENNGISHFIEHMMFKGTERRSYKQIASSIESIGGMMNAFTTKEHTCYYAKVLDEFSGRAVDVLGDMVQHSTFPEREIEKEKTVVLEEIKQSEDDPDDLVHEYFDKHLFEGNPLGRQIIGTAKNVSSFTRDELLSHVRSKYVPENIVVSAAGNIAHDTFVEMVSRSLTMKRGSKRKTPDRNIPKPRHCYQEYPRPIQQAHCCTGTVAFSIHDKQRYPALVLNTLLGDGMSSRLFQQVREKHGLAYSVYSYLSLMSQTGVFGIYLGTDRQTAKKALDLSYGELMRVKERPVSAAELRRVKAQLKGNMLLSLESTSNRMMRLGTGEMVLGEYTPLESIVRDIDAVTPADVQAVARRLFALDRFTTVLLTPENQERHTTT